MTNNTKIIHVSFEKWASEKVESISLLPATGSNRKYYRIIGASKSAIAVYNDDYKENRAFISFSRHFLKQNLRVPTIYYEDLENNIYLQQDLGDQTLFSSLSGEGNDGAFTSDVKRYYLETIQQLPQFQIRAAKGLDFAVCYPRASFDKQSMFWDLNYFKYYFLKLAKIPFDEQLLEDDFKTLVEFLLSAPRDYFLYRDFQSRNIMINKDQVYFIDYQGGRKGALQYDIASLLYDAKANLDDEYRKELLHRYIEEVLKIIPIDKNEFLQYYQGYVFIRIMQALGAYGFRGFYERKAHFLQSVPYALKNIERLLKAYNLPVKIPTLTGIWREIAENSPLRHLNEQQQKLTVRINSFSFKNSIPVDDKGHGGGFIFDCRSLPNPGRQEKYKHQNGYDQPVINFFQKEKAVSRFLKHIYGLITPVVENYQQRNFTNLQISFGCTGGQHRSVYCANRLTEYLKSRFDIAIKLNHIEQNISENL